MNAYKRPLFHSVAFYDTKRRGILRQQYNFFKHNEEYLGSNWRSNQTSGSILLPSAPELGRRCATWGSRQAPSFRRAQSARRGTASRSRRWTPRRQRAGRPLESAKRTLFVLSSTRCSRRWRDEAVSRCTFGGPRKTTVCYVTKKFRRPEMVFLAKFFLTEALMRAKLLLIRIRKNGGWQRPPYLPKEEQKNLSSAYKRWIV